MPRKIDLMPHNPQWASHFAAEAKRLTAVFQPIIVAIHHIGSTAVPGIARHLNFRDYLIAHPDIAQAYGRLKETLARRYPNDVPRYTEAKSAFIRDVDEKAGLRTSCHEMRKQSTDSTDFAD